jgi:hydroxymethylpyrimidine/phosphomethylpyrimidine kinase
MGVNMKNILSIGSSDCSGISGIQADIKTICAHGTYGMSVVTSIMASNTQEVLDIVELDPKIIREQMDAVFQDIKVDAVKIGLLCSSEQISAVVEKLSEYKPQIVIVDPVMLTKTSGELPYKNYLNALVTKLLPMATVVTPNLAEAVILAGMEINTPQDVRDACVRIKKFGSDYVLIKSGGIEFEPIDVLYDGSQYWRYESLRINTKNTMGAGATLAASIAANLAVGGDVPQSVALAKKYIAAAVEQHIDLGSGIGTINHFYKFFRKR